MKIKIVPAVENDLFDVASVQIRSWQAGYADLLPQTFLDALDVNTKWDEWKTIFQSRSPEEDGLYLARQTNKTVGFIAFGKSRDPDRKEWGEIYALYLIPEVWGQGVGKALFQLAYQRFREKGFQKAHVWLLDTNLRACRAYEKWGGHRDDRAHRSHLIGGKSVTSIGMIFTLRDSPS